MVNSRREILQSCEESQCSDFQKTLGKISQPCPSPTVLENAHEVVSKQLPKQRSKMMDAVPFSNDGLQGI